MNQKESGKQERSPQAKRPNILEQYGSAPLAFIMKNPKMTPVILLILALVPILTVALILALVFLNGGFEQL